ncbi:MAG: hypothetical protein ACOC3V_04120 [bacterium]
MGTKALVEDRRKGRREEFEVSYDGYIEGVGYFLSNYIKSETDQSVEAVFKEQNPRVRTYPRSAYCEEFDFRYTLHDNFIEIRKPTQRPHIFAYKEYHKYVNEHVFKDMSRQLYIRFTSLIALHADSKGKYGSIERPEYISEESWKRLVNSIQRQYTTSGRDKIVYNPPEYILKQVKEYIEKINNHDNKEK